MSSIFQTFFYEPVLNLLVFIYNVVPFNDLGVAIIILTIIIKLLLYPLSKKALKSQKELQELQPKIEELKKKHGNKKDELGKALMDLYKENKVNPFSSCLPLLVQLPFLFAVFAVFRDGFENGVLDKIYPFISRPEVIEQVSFGFLDLSERSIGLAFMAGLAQYWQSKMMISKRPQVKTEGSKDEDMMAIMNKQMMYFMPVLTVVISMSFPAGLALYWFVTTILTVGQQYLIFGKDDKKTEEAKTV